MFTLAVVGLYVSILLLLIIIATRFEKSVHVFLTSGCVHDLVGKTIVVTGGNSGLGYHVAEKLATRGARIILACRDLHKAAAAKRQITAFSLNHNIITKRLNLSSLLSIKEFCTDLLASEERVDILINNAGAIHLGDHLTADKLQITWQTNYFGPFLLTNLLLKKLISSNGKVINVTGQFCSNRASLLDINKYSPVVWAQRTCPNLISDILAYFNSKSALYESSFALARRLGTTGSVCVFAVNPTSTNFYRRVFLGPIALVYFCLNILFPRPEAEADKLIELILRDAYIPNEDIFEDCLTEELWKQSCELVHI